MSYRPVNPKSPPTHLRMGQSAERIARDALTAKGWLCLKERYLTKLGEIDLVMLDCQTLVFVEVRARSVDPLVDPLESITPDKQHRLIRTAECYLQSHPKHQHRPCRFDVVSVLGDLLNPKITWIPDAFQVE